MPGRKRSANKTRKMIMTAVIGSLAALGIGGAGYVTWSAISGSQAGKAVASVQSTQLAEKRGTAGHSAAQKKSVAKRKVKSGTSCKITKSKKQKVANHKASKHKRKKLRHAH